MKIELSVDNNYLNLCTIKTSMSRKGRKLIHQEWQRAEKFMKNSNFHGKQNLTISLKIDNQIYFNKTKVKHKEDFYQNVFQLLEDFIMDKIYFFNKLDSSEKSFQLEQEYVQNQLNLITIKKLNKEMRKR